MTKQEALEEISYGYCNNSYFTRFLKKMDRSSEGELVEDLFGSQEAYIDTAGNYDKEGEGGSIIDFEFEHGYDVEAIFKWYCTNFEKAWRWMFPLKNKVSQKQTEKDNVAK